MTGSDPFDRCDGCDQPMDFGLFWTSFPPPTTHPNPECKALAAKRAERYARNVAWLAATYACVLTWLGSRWGQFTVGVLVCGAIAVGLVLSA